MTHSKQQGFSLFMVMIVMIIIALLVVVTSQSSSTEMRLGANDADKKVAMSHAETALQAAEKEIGANWGKIPPQSGTTATNSGNNNVTAIKNTKKFSLTCDRGLCTPSEYTEADSFKKNTEYFVLDKPANPKKDEVAWKRQVNNKSVFDDDNHSIKVSDNVSYIVEYLGQQTVNSIKGDYFRITARAKGNNSNTVVMLQSYVMLQEE